MLPHEVASVTITILLAISFSGKFADSFVKQMTSPTTFGIYQHAMLTYLNRAPEKGKQNLTDDYVIILQKITSREPSLVSS